ncbi:Deoxyguanosinetriphosphate triphosphohydrolase-like protein [Candidatus Desulfarcum epimagneticum]|uniref:Deoxyguanosinetriphosphate triphosphohydrolase-like protein n=1 Tax=uncultured Desulfobacteraceae bacterium TaxID=218296 RepID=A0A484HE47_9BACT|nr:Deoxyguanosinetriphosphate triphosphohydrolase-like protein [uncultured Desulfobacteraceae bacterium]
MNPDKKNDARPTSIREAFEKREESFMSPAGCLSAQSRGREKKEDPCPVRTAFQTDRDRIVYSNAFRRLKYKTQVFLSPMGDMYRTRLTHTLEVSQMARLMARSMRLNEDLAEAVALAHDLGHPPFGHSGEAALQEINPEGFSHSRQSLRVVDALERKGRGLNLSFEVRDGILKHSKGYGKIIPDDPAKLAATYEGMLVRIADIMAYLNHDLEDAERSGVIRQNQIPGSCVEILGKTHSERATTMIHSLIFLSELEDGRLSLRIGDEVYSAMKTLRVFLYDNVYRSPRVHREFLKAKKIVSDLYFYFLENNDALENELTYIEIEASAISGRPKEKVVCDLIASMTDRHALSLYSRIFFPSPLV